MFACVCNALRESQVRAAWGAGCRSPEEVCAFLGARLECRACVAELMPPPAGEEAGVAEALLAS